MNRTNLILLIIVVVVLLAVVIYTLSNSNRSHSPSLINYSTYDNMPVSGTILSQLVIPNSIANEVGKGNVSINASPTEAPNLTTVDGKPLVMYVGAEWCNFCAIERWPLVIALLRFGNISGLSYMTSTAFGSNLQTFTFYNSNYTSKYITFIGIETGTNNYISANDQAYAPLQSLNLTENETFMKYNPDGGIPFLYFANKSYIDGSIFDRPFSGNWATVAGNLDNVSSNQTRLIIGSANLITAQICMADNNQPTNVCDQPYVTEIETE